MNTQAPFSSVRLAVALFVCGFSPLLLFNFSDTDFTTCALSALFGFALVLFCFVPSAVIKRRTGLDFITLAKRATPSGIIFVFSYYALSLVFTATGFLLRYADMFSNSLNSQTNVYVLAVLLLLACIYAAHKGISVLTRSAVFIFALMTLFILLISCGNISNLNFNANVRALTPSYASFIHNISLIFSTSFIAVIFAFNSHKTNKFSIRQIVIMTSALLLCALIFLFFISFSLGDYANRQPYQLYLLSKTANFGGVMGMDSLYLAAVTSGTFILISAVLLSLKQCGEGAGNMKILLLFALIIFVLFVCAESYNSVKEILTNPYILNTLNLISAVIIPAIYIFSSRKAGKND